MGINLKELEEIYYSKKKSGIGYKEIRKELTEKRIPDIDITYLIRRIDSRIIDDDTIKSKTPNILSYNIMGWFLFIGGCVLTFGSYFGLIDLKGYVVIAYGSILSGISIIFANKYSLKKHKNNFFGKKRN